MSRSTPSLLALLGLVAVAGYQNRDKLGHMLADARQKAAPLGSSPAASTGLLGEIGQFFQGGSVTSALGDLVEQFKSSGQGPAVESWVSDKANMPIGVNDLESALGAEMLEDLSQKTGLTPAELLLRLNVALPKVLDTLTPDGRLPMASEAQAYGY
jgi:uncharacterized protein YidB (DUF937 family)